MYLALPPVFECPSRGEVTARMCVHVKWMEDVTVGADGTERIGSGVDANDCDSTAIP